MTELEAFLTEQLQKATEILNTIEDRYRDAAFPIILQALVQVGGSPSSNGGQLAQDGGLAAQPAPRISPTLSVNEFFHKARPDTHPARFVCAAYYLLHTGKAEQFTQADILEIYQKLREPQPKNPADVLNQCIRKAHIIDAPSSPDRQKRWMITPEGEKFTEGLLNGNANGSK
jgi:hypothetical protein